MQVNSLVRRQQVSVVHHSVIPCLETHVLLTPVPIPNFKSHYSVKHLESVANKAPRRDAPRAPKGHTGLTHVTTCSHNVARRCACVRRRLHENSVEVIHVFLIVPLKGGTSVLSIQEREF